MSPTSFEFETDSSQIIQDYRKVKKSFIKQYKKYCLLITYLMLVTQLHDLNIVVSVYIYEELTTLNQTVITNILIICSC